MAVGSPLGTLFATLYMGTVGEQVYEISTLSVIYKRYTDDTLTMVENEEEIVKLTRQFQQKSVLNFPCEHTTNGRLPFLHILVHNQEDNISSEVYHKPTNIGMLLNSHSECPEKYHNSVINTYERCVQTVLHMG